MVTIPSITARGIHEPFYLQVSRGQILEHETVFKFGFNPDVNGTEETIWDVGGIYAYPGSAVAMTVTTDAGTPANDNGVKVIVFGLDEDYNEVNQEVTLAGAGTATTTQTFLRVFRAYVSGSQAPTGNLNITNGGTTYARITVGENQTLMAMWTVPAGYTGFLDHVNIATGTTNANQYVTAQIVQRTQGGVFRVMMKQTLGSGGIADFLLRYPILVPEKTDLEVRAVSSGANNLISSNFSIVYIKNPYEVC
tara:strand:- start:87 stop:839 length:753 start_codon:yes stop_codon:yes gene_type:complete